MQLCTLRAELPWYPMPLKPAAASLCTDKASAWVCFEPQNLCGKLQRGRSPDEALHFVSNTYTRGLSLSPALPSIVLAEGRKEEGGKRDETGAMVTTPQKPKLMSRCRGLVSRCFQPQEQN